MTFWNSLGGMTELLLTCGDVETALKQIAQTGAAIYNVSRVDALTCGFLVRRADYSRIPELCCKKCYTLKIIAKHGIYWKLMELVNHRIALAGFVFLVFLFLFLPTRVLFVQIQGNDRVPARQIIAAAEACGIRIGASRRKVRSEKLKNRLLASIPDLKWAGINTYGCTAVISVKEKSPGKQEAEQTGQVCSIVASRDGVIDSCTVTRGNPLCQVGQAVSKGDILISGYTDCGICIRAARAEGEVVGLTNRSLEAVIPAEYIAKSEETYVKKRYSLLIGKKRINLWTGSGIWDTTCGRMYQEYVLTLPGGFSLPLSLAVNIYTGCNTVPEKLLQGEAQTMLRDFSSGYLSDHMIAGEILQKKDVFLEETDVYRLFTGFYCREIIGIVQWEQDGDINGKNS